MSTLCVIIMMFCYDLDEQKIKEIPHNVGGSLTDDFQPSAACKFLDLPPGACQPVRRGSADPSSLKTVHWTVFRALVPLKSVHWTDFRALEPSKPAKFAGHAWLKFTRHTNTQLCGISLECVSKFGKMHLAGNSVAVTAS